MNPVKTQQHDLLEAIYNCRNLGQFDDRGLSVYRANLRATAIQALRITFPTVHHLIGDDLLGPITERLLEMDPPQMGDWARWGKLLPKVLQEFEVLESFPYLHDCAQLDYICHQIVRCADIQINSDSIALMQSQPADKLKLRLNSSLRIIESDYPIAEIRAAHQLSESKRSTALADIRDRYVAQDFFHVACYRDGYRVRVKSLSAVEARWLGMLNSSTLEEALNNIEKERFDFGVWLLEGVRTNLIEEIIVTDS